MKIALAGLGALAMVIALVFYQGYIDMILWNWFVAPLGAPSLNLVQAIGLSIAIYAIAVQKGGQQAKGEELYYQVFGGPAIALVGGWIVRMFM